jgi:tetrapyrrole methylase family protein/MazG family protein
MSENTPPTPGNPSREEKFRQLCEIVARLRSDTGCPWDRARKRSEVGHDLIEEAYEVLDALQGSNPSGLSEELGDLLFQILFMARIAEEAGDFDIGSVLTLVTEKMIRRHPHVFEQAGPMDIEEVRRNWHRIKQEVEGRTAPTGCSDVFGETLPTLARVQLVSSRAARAGFDWPDIASVLVKIDEEMAEFRAALKAGNQEQIGEEAGDLLFTLVNLCRFACIDAEAALRSALSKFTTRFSHMESQLARQGKTMADAPPSELDALWEEAKERVAIARRSPTDDESP